MNKSEELFRKKATKIVMIGTVLGFVVILVGGIYYFSNLNTNPSPHLVTNQIDAAREHPQATLRPLLVTSDILGEIIKYIVFGTIVFLLNVLVTLFAINLPVIMRSIALPIVWLIVLFMRRIGWFERSRAEVRIKAPYNPLFSGLLSLSRFLFSKKTYCEVFEPIVEDLNCELYDALEIGDELKIEWLNVTYVYAILSTIVERSPIGDFIEFIRKIAK